MLGQSLPSVVISFWFGRDRFAFSVGFSRRDLPLFGLLFLPQVFEVGTVVAGEIGVDPGPLLVDGFELIVLELYSPAIGLPGIQVEMYVRMVGIPMDSAERNRLRKCLFKEVIRQISDLLIGRRYIKREDYSVMRSSSLPPFVVFQRAEIEPEVLAFLPQ